MAWLLLALLLVPATAGAQPCADVAAGNAFPSLVNPRLSVRTMPLCFRRFAVLHSGATRTPLWSAERLTRDMAEGARDISRVDSFRPEERLAPADRAELRDYSRSGFDRGHMTPAGDMPDADSMYDTFSLANMVPQAHLLNTGVWERIERATRSYAERAGTLFVVTGPAFKGAQLRFLRDRVAVPSHVWKAVYDPARGAAAYLVPNVDQGEASVVSIAELRAFTGVDPFPSVPEAIKSDAMTLPEPAPERAGGRRERDGRGSGRSGYDGSTRERRGIER